MADTYKILGQAHPAAATPADAYTVPGATSAIISSIVVAELGGAAATFRISVAVAGAVTEDKQYLAYDVAINANSVVTLVLGITLAATDKIRVYGSTADLAYNIFGVEKT